METIDPIKIISKQQVDNAEEEFDRNFKPRGAIAFFILFALLGALIWYGIYYIMLSRA